MEQVVRFDATTITAIFAGVAAVLTALGTIILQLRQVHRVVNSNFSDLKEDNVALREALGDTDTPATKSTPARKKAATRKKAR